MYNPSIQHKTENKNDNKNTNQNIDPERYSNSIKSSHYPSYFQQGTNLKRLI